MTEKVPCQKCNELILPYTAEKTGGICMACKQGVREEIEQSKEYYRKQKEYDPYRELWTHLVKKVHAEGTAGFNDLTKEEKLYFAVSIFEGEVYNGGMYQFFSNSSGEYYAEVVEGLKTLNAFNSLSLLKQAAEVLFGEAEPPKDSVKRWTAMKQLPDAESEPRLEWDKELDEIDRLFYEDQDNLIELLTDYAEKTGIIHPFKLKNN
jgi:hypothetical protein